MDHFKAIKIRKSGLSDWWLDNLSDRMHEHFPDIIGTGDLIDCWKRDGWNDGITTLFGVYKVDSFFQCSFPDYAEPECVTVNPIFKHTGWEPLQSPTPLRLPKTVVREDRLCVTRGQSVDTGCIHRDSRPARANRGLINRGSTCRAAH